VLDVAEDSDQHQRDRLAEVQGLAGFGQDRFGVVQVGVDVFGDALGRAEQQYAGMCQHEWIVVDVDDP
jgi:hypothetical protein